MSAARFDASYTGIGEMLNAPFMVAEMSRRAENIRTLAEATAPVYQGEYDPHRGLYKASFEAEAHPYGGIHRDRAEGRVRNSAWYAVYVEYGNRGAEPYHHLLNSLIAGAQL